MVVWYSLFKKKEYYQKLGFIEYSTITKCVDDDLHILDKTEENIRKLEEKLPHPITTEFYSTYPNNNVATITNSIYARDKGTTAANSYSGSQSNGDDGFEAGNLFDIFQNQKKYLTFKNSYNKFLVDYNHMRISEDPNSQIMNDQ